MYRVFQKYMPQVVRFLLKQSFVHAVYLILNV